MTSDSSPPEEVTALEARCRRIETTCGDGTMVWRVWGEGEPLVLGHGAQGSWGHWIRNIDALVAENRMVIAVDLPGHGDTAMPASPDHRGIADALAAGIREILGDGLPADFVGFSFGGTAFAYLAALHPGIVRRLILVGCGGLDTPLGQVDLRRIAGTQGEERKAAIKANILGLMLHHPESVDDLAMYLQVRDGKRARLKDPGGFVLPDKLLKALPDITVPVDAIWGEFDRPHPDPHVQEEVLRRFNPDADFRVIDGAGHWAMFERPEQFNRTLIDMLARHPVRAA